MSEEEELVTEVEEIVPFNVIKENWNEYELNDGTIIKTKFVLMNIIKTPEKNEQGQNLTLHQSQTLISIYSPVNIRGPKDRKYSVEELEDYITNSNVFFRMTKDGGMNEYETEKQVYNIKNRVIKVDITSKFDSFGNPAYIVRSETQVILIEKEEIKR